MKYKQFPVFNFLAKKSGEHQSAERVSFRDSHENDADDFQWWQYMLIHASSQIG
jgi:hypothetical protein